VLENHRLDAGEGRGPVRRRAHRASRRPAPGSGRAAAARADPRSWWRLRRSRRSSSRSACQSDVLFAFDKAELRPEGQKKIDEIAGRLKGANVQQINMIGHADRIGPDQYNQKLSEKRAEAVKEYLSKQGVETTKVRAEGRGKSEPVTGNECKGEKGSKLIACLQPDRRVDIEVRGEKETASTGTSPSAGGTSGSGTLGTPSGSSTGASPSSGSSSGSTK
jgi:outer membrane protein OmpA-like peptidoglycan-associated protein